jgi:phage baseplate assembly protein W|tara:strand:+ start:183 stop:590 length:408 start_codon:yes stop_codon:yes gene_type:complete
MAFGATRIFPNDQRPSVAIGFNLPMNEGGVFTPNYQTKEAIKNNLINYFLTNPGERPGNPTFGAGLRNYIFTQIDQQDLSFIQDDIQTKVLTFFPEVQIEEITVLPTERSNTININLTYSVSDTNISDTLDLSFN